MSANEQIAGFLKAGLGTGPTPREDLKRVLLDPASSETYEYQALDSLRYKVCATFDGESLSVPGEATTIPPAVQLSCQGCHAAARIRVDDPVTRQFKPRDLWTHGTGRQCFQLQAR